MCVCGGGGGGWGGGGGRGMRKEAILPELSFARKLSSFRVNPFFKGICEQK